MNKSNENTIFVHLPDAGTTIPVPVKDLSQATPALLLSFLERERALPPARSDRPYQIRAGGQDLIPNISLAAQNIGPGAELFIQREGTGA
jgi:hypothetical protein